MMGSFRRASTPGGDDRRPYMSWCVDPAETPADKDHVPLKKHLMAPSGSESAPRLLLTPPETRGTSSKQHPQLSVMKRRHEEAFTTDSDRSSHGLSLGHEEDTSQSVLPVLLRSSPVISRRPISWHGGGPDSSDASRSLSSSLDQHLEFVDLHSSSGCVSSNLNVDPHLHLSEQQGLDADQRGRGLSGCHTFRSAHSGSFPEFSAELLRTRCELEQENSHFVMVDLVLEVLEGAKWTLMMDTQQHTQHSKEHRQHTQQHSSSAEDEPTQSHTHTRAHTLSDHAREDEYEDAMDEESDRQLKTFSVLSTDSGFEDGGLDLQTDSLRHAEHLAQQLVSEFRRSWIPSRGPRCGRQSLRSSLQELPGCSGVMASSSLMDQVRLRTRMRGHLSWIPPPVQIIFNVQPNHRRCDIVALQSFLCAGCGTELEQKHIRKLQYCDYLGRYFCDCCHSGSEAVIPARVLTDWDFSRFPVSDFSRRLLESVWFQPLFDLSRVGQKLCRQVKELQRFRELQDQLLGLKRLLRACRLSQGVMSEFDLLPAHLSDQPHLFSMDDLLRVKKGQLVGLTRAVVNAAIGHVENCQLCQARGFICEFCRDSEVIFPFQTTVCARCPACRSCFHKHCFMDKACPKCARIKARRNQSDRAMKRSDDEEE